MLAIALAILRPPPATAQTSDDILYVMPSWSFPASDSAMADQVNRLRNVIGEGRFVRVGFTVYVDIRMTDWSVDLTDRTAVRAALASTITAIEESVARAQAHGIPLCLSFLTAIRWRMDPVQSDSVVEDRRSMQWYNDNGLATGWWTHSRYARKIRRVQEAYIREVGAVVADLMRRYPDTLVAASGDGEVELAFERLAPGATSVLADYSPFTVLEFRDWLQGEGLYAPGGALAGEAYEQAARYAGDLSPALDSNGDGHTLNGDFGVNFSSWQLRFGDWSLDDDVDMDPNAIPAAEFTAPDWMMADAGADRFDAPRTRQTEDVWWEAWALFRQMMIWRHNIDFARWMTSSPDATGATIPPSRWYSDQIPADYLFGHSPANPHGRLHTSASPWWTADVFPYGSIGITAFNVNLGGGGFARTLVNVAPHVAARGRRWGILEWNPSVPKASTIDVYQDEMDVIERFRPSLIVPYVWGSDERYGIEGTPFETALGGLVDRLEDGLSSLTLSASVLQFAGIRDGGILSAITPMQVIAVTQAGGAAWTVSSDQPWVEITSAHGAGSGQFGVSIVADPGLPPVGTTTATVTVSAIGPAEVPVTVDVSLNVLAQTTSPPFGQMDTPTQNETGVVGAVPVTGWALDDVGVAGVRIFRNCLTFDHPASCQIVEGQPVVFVGDATFVPGARPDVEAAFPAVPRANVGAWGYMLLSNVLPHVPRLQPQGGQGPLTLYALATDVEGHRTWLGRLYQTDFTPTRITMANDTIAKPFGAIDTPASGETISGESFVSFGWVLTPDIDTDPGPDDTIVPTDGSTVTVLIDGAVMGPVIYDQCRGNVGNPVPDWAFCNDDVSNIFGNATPLPLPQSRTSNPTRFRNLDAGRGPIAAHVIDTTTLSNGLHTIVWIVTDSAGRAEGIGSRFMTVRNGAMLTARALAVAPTVALATAGELDMWPTAAGIVRGRQGFDLSAPWEVLTPDSTGHRAVRVPAQGRVEVSLGEDSLLGGYLVANGTLRALPPGSRLDRVTKIFTWAPGPGYIGTYDLAFLRLDGTQVPLRVTLDAAADVTGRIEAALDRPDAGAHVSRTFAVEGWALDTGAWQGTGVGAVHVWAQRLDAPGVPPTFLGSARMSGRRSDVAARFGAQFEPSGWALVAELPAGTYEITAYVWSGRTRQFEDARSVTTTVR